MNDEKINEPKIGSIQKMLNGVQCNIDTHILFPDSEIRSANKENIESFTINNRKYIGSKQRLLSFIEKIILQKCNIINIFIDGFAGTGVVANHFKQFSKKVISNDILYSNYVINKVFLNLEKKYVNKNKVFDILKKLNELNGIKGYVFKNFGGTYFTKENAKIIDEIRETIEKLYIENNCTMQEKYILLASLLFAIDKIANTVGQYDAFLKNIGEDTYNKDGIHKIDSNVYKRIKLKIPLFNFDGHNEVYNEDLNLLITKIKGDVLYLDPPYNTRQYIDNYHVLENILKWEKPTLFGKTKKFKREPLKSKYSRKNEAFNAFNELINNADVQHIFLSYNNEGIICKNDILKVLENKGKIELFENKYSIFGNGAGRSQKRKIIERIYYCRVKK